MCFSSTASFSSGILLAATGLASFTKAKSTAQRLLATIPLIFSFQQFTEGMLWLSLLYPAWHKWQQPATYLFLFFAQAVWPVYMPLSMLLFEDKRSRRRLMLLLLSCGVALFLYTVYALYRYPVHALVANHHILYSQEFPLAQHWYYGLLYLLPTVLSPMISSKKNLRWLGYLFLVAYALTRLLFHFYEISVWCFFGAVISFSIYFLIGRVTKKNKLPS